MQTTEKLSITLPFDMADMVRGSVQSGAYASNSEVIRDALRLWQDQQVKRRQRLEWLREQIQAGRESGELIDGEASLERLEAKYQAMTEGSEA